jgi:allophanate hydrolase subunit 1
MKGFILVGAFAMAGLLAACGDDNTCTQESATAKATEVMTAMQALATSNPEKLAEMTPRLTEIQATLTAEGADLAAACKALDDLQTEITAAAAPAQ